LSLCTDDDDGDNEEVRPLDPTVDAGAEPSNSSSFLLGKNWRDLIPVIKIDMVSPGLAPKLHIFTSGS
jgi:hypothetical protein